ncbi:MAG: hypothetical protein MUE45_05780 [Methanoregulaceae archaeon]|jgi:hypothetical protein|nr:hypothetical protein [Methanoregulaceae archaeon]MCU0628977.1 hypothetical protein [Methanoregulaceae archaeon]
MPSTRGVYIAYAMQGVILLEGIFGLFIRDPSIIFTAFIGFFLTCIPYLIGRRIQVTLPWEVNFLIAFAVFLHVAGYSQQLYIILYPYYDKFAHFISSITVAVLAFVSILLINRFSCTKLARWQIFFYIVIFTMAIGAFWEIYEYLLDTFFGSYLTKLLQHGLDDTMIDLIIDLVGGIIIALFGTWYIQKKTLAELTNPMVGDSQPECEL